MKTNKSVREMTPRERRRHSLTTRSFLGVQGLFFVIGVLILAAGFLLYLSGTMHSYCVHTAKLAQAETLLLDPEQTRAKAEEILSIYDSIPEEERGDGKGKAYQRHFADTIDDNFRAIQKDLATARDKMKLRNAFIVAIDEDSDRMIYLVDSDQKETFCFPGSWDDYSDSVINALVHGDRGRSLEARFDPENTSQATSAEGELFGTDRMLAAAGATGDASSRQVLDSITKAVNDFVGDNEQFDDLTMLCVEYRG